ncbi:MAG: hypothetical protein ACYS7Y_30000 [Planctomycetota bacterium]|jgi:hypothetical protein
MADDIYIFKYLRNGAEEDLATATGTPGAPEHFDYVADSDYVKLHRCMISIRDDGISPFDFGAISGGLTNGLQIRLYDASDKLVTDFTDGVPIKTNGQFVLLAGVDVDRDVTAGDDQLTVRWTFAKAGEPLHMKTGDYFRVSVQDTLTAMTAMAIVVQGSKRR